MTRVECATGGVVRDVGDVRGVTAACLRHPAVNSKEAVRVLPIKTEEAAGARLIY